MGYLGEAPAAEVLIEGLRCLEYRGYDSAGIAVYQNQELQVERAKGKLSVLESRLKGKSWNGTVGIGHTRWATHGKPSDENAHPHRSKQVVVVHNGIIENHLELRSKLKELGFTFQSETDTEIVPVLIEHHLRSKISFEEAIRKSLAELKGAFALVIMSLTEPDKIIAAKNSSPLIIGIGKGENFLASDIPALLRHTREVLPLEDGELVVLTKESWRVTDFSGNPKKKSPRQITWSRVMAEKEGYKHFMLKEIFEQPRVLTDTLRGRVLETSEEVVLDDIALTSKELSKISRAIFVACGTSWHAALVGKFWLEGLAKIPCEVDLASEFRYRQPVIDSSVLMIAISQSGETADTLAAIDEAKRGEARVLSICNVIDSSIARKSNDVLYTHAGPEIGVASTKAFTTQLAALAMIALHVGQEKGQISKEQLRKSLHALIQLPKKVEEALATDSKTQDIANRYFQSRDFLFLGRGSSFPIALEGALKLKEISYIHAEGYAGGEIKHGPIALIDEEMPVVALATGGRTYPKMMSNIEEVRARGGQVIALVQKGDTAIEKLATEVIELPELDDFTRPIVEVVPLQLLAYHIADRRGTDVDQPRNLAKSVTVE